jgi:hypothetical protein
LHVEKGEQDKSVKTMECEHLLIIPTGTLSSR